MFTPELLKFHGPRSQETAEKRQAIVDLYGAELRYMRMRGVYMGVCWIVRILVQEYSSIAA